VLTKFALCNGKIRMPQRAKASEAGSSGSPVGDNA